MYIHRSIGHNVKPDCDFNIWVKFLLILAASSWLVSLNAPLHIKYPSFFHSSNISPVWNMPQKPRKHFCLFFSYKSDSSKMFHIETIEEN